MLTLDPERLHAFVAELNAAGFDAADDGRTFVGPLPSCLAPFTNVTTMKLVINEPWPYRQPSVHVAGIDWWHAAHDAPCLWQLDDNTKRWLTFAGIVARVEEWAEKAQEGFTGMDGAALDPHLYFKGAVTCQTVGIDVDGLVGHRARDGQHGKFASTPDPLNSSQW